MTSHGWLRAAWVAVFRRSQFEGDMDEELREHLRYRAEELARAGMPRREAERQARLEFGGLEHYKEECRESAGAHFTDVLWQDLRFAGRQLSKSPGFALIAVATLALGIGANTAIFSLTHAVLLRPLPYAHAGRLVLLFESNMAQGVPATGCSYPDLEALRDSGSFSNVAGVNRHALILTGAGEPAELDTVVVTPEMFPLLSAKPLVGRYLVAEDGRVGAAPTVVISESLWRSRFGGRADVVGRPIVLDQKVFTVAGIMPASFRVPVFGERQDIWIPLAQDPLFGSWMSRRGGHWLRVMAELKANTSLKQAQEAAAAISKRLARLSPASDGEWAVQVVPLQKAIVADVRTPLLVLSGAVGLVLLLACVNIANLLLARATTRMREFSVRRAVGAARGRIVRQLLTESAVLGVLGSALGILLAYGSVRMLPALFPPDSPAMRQVNVDPAVLGFALLVSLGATVSFGLAPALAATGSDLQSSLRDSASRSGASAGSLRTRRILAGMEIGLAVILVIGAGLLVRSLMRMTAVNPGFEVQHILKAEISLPRFRYATPQQWRAFSGKLLERVHATPGLQNSAMAVPVPLGDGFINLGFSIPGHAMAVRGAPSTADYVAVSPEYFHVMGIPLVRGRLFDSRDSESEPGVTIISESLARLYFRGQDPTGQKLKFGFPPSGDVERTIVGVAGNVRDAGLRDEPGPMMYVPFEQAPFWGGDLVVNSTAPVGPTVASIREVVRRIDPDLPVSGVMTMPEVMAGYVAQPKMHTVLLGLFGGMSLLLAGLGVFGVLSYSVVSRMREFGVRAALGATPGSIAQGVVIEAMSLGIGGLAAGLAVAAGLVRFLKSELYGVAAYDPVTFFGSAAVLLALALTACYLPARRAMSIDPVIALRAE